MRISPSGSKYIGQTSFDESKRWKEHSLNAYRKNRPDYNYPLSAAIRKYGADNFDCVILEDNIEDAATLHDREMYWISYYNTYKDGLNATYGGEGNKVRDTELINKLWDEGYCVRDICLLLNSWPSTILKHLRVSKEECQKRGPIYKSAHSKNTFGNYTIGKGITISCFDMNTGEHVKTFKSYYEAAKYVDAKSPSTIYNAAIGICKSCKGYYWRIGDDTTPLTKDDLKEKRTTSKKKYEYVVCIETMNMYETAVLAEKLTGTCYRSIIYVCKGRQKTAGGSHWRYATNDDKEKLNLIKDEEKVDKQPDYSFRYRSVVCLETNEVFQSITSAAKLTGVTPSAIMNCCKGKTKTSGGYHWKYFNNIEQNEHKQA